MPLPPIYVGKYLHTLRFEISILDLEDNFLVKKDYIISYDIADNAISIMRVIEEGKLAKSVNEMSNCTNIKIVFYSEFGEICDILWMRVSYNSFSMFDSYQNTSHPQQIYFKFKIESYS